MARESDAERIGRPWIEADIADYPEVEREAEDWARTVAAFSAAIRRNQDAGFRVAYAARVAIVNGALGFPSGI